MFENIEHIKIQDGSYNSSLFSLTVVSNHTVKSITIGNNCYHKVFKVKIKNCENLSSLLIGENCFRENEMQSYLQIIRNPTLKECRIGDYCFEYFESIRISGIQCQLCLILDCAELRVLWVGINCFKNAGSITLKSRFLWFDLNLTFLHS